MFELMLVLAIAATAIFFGFNQIQMMKNDRDAQLVQYNVDVLFQALGQYYRANCRDPINTSGTPISHTGSLDPSDSNNPTATNPYPILNNGTNLLLTNGYLTVQQWPPSINSLVDNDSVGAGGTSNGYIAQFNLVSPSPTRTSSATYFNWATSGATSITMPASVGNIYIWRAQVAMKLPAKLAAQAQLYRGQLGADCVSSLNGATVLPCSSNPAPGGYLVWERLPSRASPGMMSNLWLTMSRIRQFTQMYTNDDMYGASNPTWATNATPPNNNYLCGE